MDATLLRSFFGWCTVLNAGFLLLSVALTAPAGNWVYRVHSRIFPMSREAFTLMMYGFIGLYKIVVLVFFLVPWLALTILG